MPISKPQQNRLAANAPTSPDHYDWLTAAARRNFPTADAIPIIIEAVEQAEMDPEHAHLDDLMSLIPGQPDERHRDGRLNRGELGASAQPMLRTSQNASRHDVPQSRVQRLWRNVRRLAASPDPLVECSNWVALTIGSHLPFWPLYVWWSAGNQAWPSALLTVTLAPVFLMIPWVSRRNGLLGRAAMPLAGIANTVFTVWILGMASGSALFLAPCAALAALLFRKSERWLMIALTALPLIVWFVLRYHAPTPLHHYDAATDDRLLTLNAISIAVLVTLFGWFQADIYHRMED